MKDYIEMRKELDQMERDLDLVYQAYKAILADMHNTLYRISLLDRQVG